SLGGPLAKRFQPDVNLFATSRDDSPEALQALAALVGPGEHVYVMQVAEITIPPGLVASTTAPGVQLVAACPITAAETDGVVELGEADAAEMLALATLTEPGPFLPRTHRMGCFLGIKLGGRLVAMAGERMTAPGYQEVSAVCTHPDFRGRGFARKLSAAVAEQIFARGQTPFLHSWKENHAAIKLYHSLGFEWRTDVNVAVLECGWGA
ncbi:MAG: GNAT family N-acetyltransferase, partial [Rhizomicrobium sp.]|nr:GNAT family N-acetyltransferase [Rhizomicrobium sp.]